MPINIFERQKLIILNNIYFPVKKEEFYIYRNKDNLYLFWVWPFFDQINVFMRLIFTTINECLLYLMVHSVKNVLIYQRTIRTKNEISLVQNHSSRNYYNQIYMIWETIIISRNFPYSVISNF